MGDYTGYVFNLSLKKETPKEIIDLLNDMFYCQSFNFEEKASAFEHKFFDTYRWSIIFRCSSAYFPNWSYRAFKENLDGSYCLISASSTKGNQEAAALFLDWIKEWIIPTTADSNLVGFSLFEYSCTPDFYYISEGNLTVKSIKMEENDADSLRDTNMDELLEVLFLTRK